MDETNVINLDAEFGHKLRKQKQTKKSVLFIAWPVC